MQSDTRPLGLRGFLIDAPSPGRLRGVRDGALLVEDGHITAYGSHESVRASHPGLDIRWMHSPETVIIPGLIDLHAHLPQYPAVARQADGTWSRRHVLPLEKQFRATAARAQAPAFFEELARHGTTCAMLCASVYEDSADAAFAAAEKSGLRIILGKVMRDIPGQDGPAQPLDQSGAESEALCRKWHGRDNGRIEYAFTPDAAASCSAELLRRAAELAAACGARIQTHLAETTGESARVPELFAERTNCAGVFHNAGLLGNTTVLAHCIHLSDEEIGLLAAAHCAVAHCPTSNLFLASGLMPLDRLRRAGLRIGLGSDVAGGPELNMWQVMRSAVETQTARHLMDPAVPLLGAAEAFYLGTQGGAGALGKEALIGSFEIGKEADLVVLDLASITPYGRRANPHASLAVEDVVTLLVYRGQSSAVVETFVRGRSIYRAPAPMLV